MSVSLHCIESARRLFPRGLLQLQGSFRFSIDALLLASFLALPPGREEGCIADLGTGCGVVALGMLLRHPRAQSVGLERQGSLAAAAMENARILGCAGRMQVVEGDLRLLCGGASGGGGAELLSGAVWQEAPLFPPVVECEGGAEGADGGGGVCQRGISLLREVGGRLARSCDLALANPPYRVLGSGRLPKEGARQEAFFGEADTLAVFCRAAAFCLREGGRFGIIFPAARLSDLCLALHGARLRVRRIVPVQTVAGAVARFVLVEAQKGSRGMAELLPPLVLHAGQGAGTAWTKEALAFCPWLGGEAG